MKKILIKLISEKYKDNKNIRILDGKGWNMDIYNRKTKIGIKIIDTNIDCCMVDSRCDDDFYEIYVYEGLSPNLRDNKFINRYYSSPKQDYYSALQIIDNILLGG